MADKRIGDFATVAEAKDDDLLLVSSENETYNIKVKTLKDAVLGNAEDNVGSLLIDADDFGLEQDETGLVYPTYQGTRSKNGIPIAAVDGGSVGSITLVDDGDGNFTIATTGSGTVNLVDQGEGNFILEAA